MAEYIEREAAENAIAAIMPTMSSPDGRGENDHLIFAAQEMCVDAIQTINNLPAADVAEVVRCKECLWSGQYDSDGYICNNPDLDCSCYRPADGFCDLGERKDGDGNG